MPLFYVVAVVALLVDQASKWWIKANLPLGATIEVWPGVFHLEHVQNMGAAWGYFHGQRAFLILFSLAIVGGIVMWSRDAVSHGRAAAAGLGLILGGAVGNLIDRVFLGAVTDFLDLDTQWAVVSTFPVFNVADSALTVGVAVLLLSYIWPSHGAKEREGATA